MKGARAGAQRQTKKARTDQDIMSPEQLPRSPLRALEDLQSPVPNSERFPASLNPRLAPP